MARARSGPELEGLAGGDAEPLGAADDLDGDGPLPVVGGHLGVLLGHVVGHGVDRGADGERR